MPVFTYSAKNLRGEEITGSMEAADHGALKRVLRTRGYYITQYKELGKTSMSLVLAPKVTLRDISVFCRQFSVMLRSGVPMVQIVDTLAVQAESKIMARALRDLSSQMQRGRLLSEAMDGHKRVFPDFLREMVGVGEAVGALADVFDNLSEFYLREFNMRRKISQALTYPAILGIMTIGIVYIIMVYVIPVFAEVLSGMGGELPGITVVMLEISRFMINNLSFVLGGLLIIVLLLYYFIKMTDPGRLAVDIVKLRLPIFRALTIKTATSRFARSMSILLGSGVPVLRAVDVMSGLLGNRAVERKFYGCKNDIRSGHTLGSAVRRIGIFPPMLTNMVVIGEESGSLPDMLSRTSSFFDDEVADALTRLTTLIEPVLMIVMAVVVGTVILAVMLPMLSVMTSVAA